MRRESDESKEYTRGPGLLRRAFPNLSGILRIIPRQRWATPTLVVLGILASLAEAAGIMLVPLFFYSMMNQLGSLASGGGALGEVLRYFLHHFTNSREIALVFLLLIVVRGILAYGYGLATSYVSEQISQITRDRVHSQYLSLPYRSVQQYDQAELIETLGREASLPSAAYTSLTRVLVNGTFLIMLGGLLMLLSWQITLCVVAGSLLLSALLYLLSGRAHSIGEDAKRVFEELWEHMMITLQGMRTIRAFGQEDVRKQRFQATSARAHQVAIATKQLTLLLDPLTEVGYLVMLGIVIVGAPYLGISFATTLTCVALLYRLQPHVREIELHRLNLLQLEPQLDSVRTILEARGDGQETGDTPIRSIERGIRFEQVSFRYQESGPCALERVSFDIPAGVTTALVGPSGSGKTTIVNLLLGLYRPDAGVVSVDGVPLDGLRRSEWLSLITVAGQDIELIDGTVSENVEMAGTAASAGAVASAAKMVEIAERLESLPEGYDTWIGQRGSRFSGGERQRVGLVRAVLHQPRLLILDEAMNAMDMASEQRVRRAIEDRFPDCTILLITHRLETVRDAEHVICIHGGQVVAEGRPGEMLLDDESVLARALHRAE
jgi:ABC-type multidrug transport system fused ATPase/permease subunit